MCEKKRFKKYQVCISTQEIRKKLLKQTHKQNTKVSDRFFLKTENKKNPTHIYIYI